MKMNLRESRRAVPPESSAGSWVTFVEIFREVRTPNLVPALAAIVFWSLLIGVVSFCYELWRLERNWRAWNGSRKLNLGWL